LLSVLAKSADRVVTRQQLLDYVWGYSYYGDARTLDVPYGRLRQSSANAATALKQWWALATVLWDSQTLNPELSIRVGPFAGGEGGQASPPAVSQLDVESVFMMSKRYIFQLPPSPVCISSHCTAIVTAATIAAGLVIIVALVFIVRLLRTTSHPIGAG